MIPRGRRLPGWRPRGWGFLSHELQCGHLGWVWGPGVWPYLCHGDLGRVSSLSEPQSHTWEEGCMRLKEPFRSLLSSFPGAQ